MKNKIIALMLGVVATLFAIILLNQSANTNKDYLRIHIRANSNSQTDQEIKYKVRDGIIEYLTPYLAKCPTKDAAMQMVKGQINNIIQCANTTLKQNGFEYASNAAVRSEEFPLRVYDSLTLEQGRYDALIVELGQGVGTNWWCVVYPPLCFTGQGTGAIKYQSKIVEIINNFMAKQK